MTALTPPRPDYTHLESECIHDLIEQQRYGVEYQPMISTHNGEIMAYEALARFYTADNQRISPLTVFSFLHHDLPRLQEVELALKKLQIHYAPADYELFINVDPHAICHNSEIGDAPLIRELSGHNSNLIVELIENSDLHDAHASIALHKVLKEKGIHTALDDIGADHALLSLEILSLVNYLKFDLSWFKKLEKHRYAFLFRSMVEFSLQSNKPCILEGIETAEMLDIAKSYRLDRVQGFHYQHLFQNIKV